MGKELTPPGWVLDESREWWERLLKVGKCPVRRLAYLAKTPPSIRISPRMTSTIGRAIYLKNEIRLSDLYLKHVNKDEFNLVIAHEAAHIFVNRINECECSHDDRWKKAMRSIDLDPNTHFKFDISPNVHVVLTCRECQLFYALHYKDYYKVISEGSNISCERCGNPYVSVK